MNTPEPHTLQGSLDQLTTSLHELRDEVADVSKRIYGNGTPEDSMLWELRCLRKDFTTHCERFEKHLGAVTKLLWGAGVYVLARLGEMFWQMVVQHAAK